MYGIEDETIQCFEGVTEGKRPLRRLRGQLNDDIKTYLKGTESGVLNGFISIRIGTRNCLL